MGDFGTTNTRSIFGSAQLTLIASKTGVDGAALASTDLTFESGIDLSTHIPVFHVLKFASGTLGIGVAKVKTGAGDLTATTALLTLTATQQLIVYNAPVSILTSSGNLTVEVTTASLGASTFNIYSYGIPRL